MSRGWRFALAVFASVAMTAVVHEGLSFDATFSSVAAWIVLFALFIDGQARVWEIDK